MTDADKLLNIKLTETEVIMIMDCIGNRIEDLTDCAMFGDGLEIDEEIQTLTELTDDLREQCFRHDDGWNDPEDPDLFMDPVDFAAKHDKTMTEQDFIQAGEDARERVKATSRAAARRALNFSPRTDEGRSEVQDVDVWNPDDPKNW
jgi:hypothetical protein